MAAMAGRPAVFISYKRGHEPSMALAVQLEAALAERFEVWRDVAIEPGERWSDELWRWLMECSGAIALVSDEAAASDWCRREWSVLAARAAHSDLRVVPVHVGPVGPNADILAHLQAITGADAVDQAVTRLAGLPTRAPSPADFLAAHHAWLRWLYEEAPALGQEPFSLADVYVDTECGSLTWGQLREDRSIDPFAEAHGGRHDLIETVLEHFAEPDFRDLVVVQGPAGSGKSAFTLRVARRLLDEGLHPVLIRFRDLRLSTYADLDTQLVDAIRVAPAGEHPPRPRDPVFTDEVLGETTTMGDATISRTVVILDGWDEVDLTGNLRFRDQINKWLPWVRQRFTDRPGPPVRLLLTGRPTAVVDRSQLLRQRTPVLTVRPMQPSQLHDYAAHISNRLDESDAAWQLDLDRCRRAFSSYATWFERGTDDGADVLGSPLLALLAFRTLAEWPGRADDLFARPTALYQALIDITTDHAGKAEDSPGGTVHRGGVELRHLLQRVATIITHRLGESVSSEELRLRLEDDRALEEWADQATGESTLHELVVNFYFKSHPELGCEFLHKSFREYLHAESIVVALVAAVEGRSGSVMPPHIDDKRDFANNTLHYRASRSLGHLLSPEWLSSEVRAHTFWLMSQAAEREPDRWVAVRDVLADVYGWWERRVHLRLHAERRRGQITWHPPPVTEFMEESAPLDDPEIGWSFTTSRTDAVLGRALIQLAAHAHAIVGAHPGSPGRPHQSVDEEGRLRFRPFASNGRSVAARLSTPDPPYGNGLAGIFLGPADLRDVRLEGGNLAGIDLAGADLRGADLSRALLREADLRKAQLQAANLWRAVLTGADLLGTDLTGADANHADLGRAHLASADLTDANLTGTIVSRAYLDGASLRHACLRGADLSGADLTGADLTGTDLTGALLAGATFSRPRADSSDDDVVGQGHGG